MKRLVLGGVLFSLLSSSEAIAQLAFPRGVMRSGFTTGTASITSREITTTTSQNFNGAVYTATGENIKSLSGVLGSGQTYTLERQGEPFQFSESYFSGGLTNITTTQKSVDTQSVTNSLSVFAEVN
jgi:hypothetical protein